MAVCKDKVFTVNEAILWANSFFLLFIRCFEGARFFIRSQFDRVRVIREFKQIATAGADTAAGGKFPQKCDTAHVRRLHPTVVRNLTT